MSNTVSTTIDKVANLAGCTSEQVQRFIAHGLFDADSIDESDVNGVRLVASFEQSGFPLDTVGSRPAAYGDGSQMSDLEREIWAKFWDYANDAQKAHGAGVRAAHGEAVSMGMVIASALSVKKGMLSAEEDQRLRAVLKNLNLPTRLETGTRQIIDAIAKDKKRSGDRIHFVLLNRIGKARLEQFSLEELRGAL